MLEYAHGFRGKVYLFDGSEYAPDGTDLVKHEQNGSPRDFALQFVQLKIARLLMPENFPEVLGCGVREMEETIEGAEFAVTYDHILYSKRVITPVEHVSFCRDIGLDGPNSKKSFCSCKECDAHRSFHDTHQKDMLETTVKAGQMGIAVPFNDPTDWCVNLESGNVTFFEINGIDVDRVRAAVVQEGNVNSLILDKLCMAYSKLVRV